MRAGTRLGLASALTMAMLLAAPAVASASPRWFVNDKLVGGGPCLTCEKAQNVVAVGSVTMNNKLFGEWKCKILAGLVVGNETEKGTAQVQTWEPFDCSTNVCRGPVYVTAEEPPEAEPVPEGKEVIYHPDSRRRFGVGLVGEPPLLPWPAELSTDAAGKTALTVHKMRLILGCPSEGLWPTFAGYLEPPIVNGADNGLSPTHLLFEGKGGHTSWLNGTWLGGVETEETVLFFSGELTILGTSQQLITAE